MQIDFLREQEKTQITYIPKPCLRRIRTCESPTTLKRGQEMFNAYLELIRQEKNEKGNDLSINTLRGIQRSKFIMYINLYFTIYFFTAIGKKHKLNMYFIYILLILNYFLHFCRFIYVCTDIFILFIFLIL
jgi:hypothetical protein